MNLKILSTQELDGRIKSLAQAEREILHDVVLTVKEIDTRKMYLDFGYPSLHDYLVEEVKYLGGTAQRRIDAARLVKDVPSAAEKIRTGELSLAQITLVQKTARKIFRTKRQTVTASEKLELVNTIANLGPGQTQQKVAAYFDMPVIHYTKKTVLADGSVRIEMTLSAEAHAKLEKAQGLVSHSVPTQEVSEFVEYVCDKIIKQKTSSRLDQARNDLGQSKQTQSTQAAPLTATVAVKSLSTSMKKSVLKQQHCCQYKNPRTGKICGSIWFTQTDHRQSLWAGGTHDRENLQILCAGHNQAKYRKEANIKYR